MARSADDLKALLLAGDTYTETVEIEYLGELFAVQIRPLTEAEITDVNRSMKLSSEMMKQVAEKLKQDKALMSRMSKGDKPTPEEEAKLTEGAVDAILSGGAIDIGDMNYMDFLQSQEYCKRGIVDDGLRVMVPKFRYGLTERISKRIQTISNVPPAVVANFFGQTPAN